MSPVDETLLDGSRSQAPDRVPEEPWEGSEDGHQERTLAAWEEAEFGPTPIATGTQVGRFVVLGLLAAGGMGQVYTAYDAQLDRKVAIKVLLRGAHAADEDRARMLREARTLARCSHPNVVTVYEVGTHEEQIYIAMEFIEGRTLRAWLREKERPWFELLRLFVDVARGLAAVHDLGLVHRDFKPDNVLVDEKGRPRLIDFGLAREFGDEPLAKGSNLVGDPSLKVTQTGALLGTPRYMAPEQFERKLATPATDQFALCVALFEGLFGVQPFRGETLATRAAAVLDHEVRQVDRGEVPRTIHAAVVRGLARDPDARWSTVEDLAETLAGHVTAVEAELKDPVVTRHRNLIIGVMASLVATVPGTVSIAVARGSLELTPSVLFLTDVFMASAAVILFWSTRHWWKGAAMGRRLASVFALFVAVIFTQDLVGWLTDRPAHDSLMSNFVSVSVVTAFASFVVTDNLMISAGWFALMGVAAHIDPPRTFAYFNLGVMGACLIPMLLRPARHLPHWARRVLGAPVTTASRGVVEEPDEPMDRTVQTLDRGPTRNPEGDL